MTLHPVNYLHEAFRNTKVLGDALMSRKGAENSLGWCLGLPPNVAQGFWCAAAANVINMTNFVISMKSVSAGRHASVYASQA